MFRKPKSKKNGGDVRNIRRRADDSEGEENKIGQKRSPSSSADEADNDQQQLNIGAKSQQKDEDRVTTPAVCPVGLSFDEREGDDVPHFKLKRHSASGHSAAAAARRRNVEKAVARKQRTVADEERTTATKTTQKQVQQEVLLSIGELEQPKQIQKMENYQQQFDGKTLTMKQQFKFKEPKGEKIDDNRATVYAAFPSAMAEIPDAKAVYEARKKREMMRQGGLSASQDFIPLEDTVRLKSGRPSGERARLVREDENDMSDEEDTGSFYSAKQLLQNEEDKRREEQAHFLAMEQGSSEEEEAREEEEKVGKKTIGSRRGGPNGTGDAERHKFEQYNNGTEEDEEEEDDALQRWEREQIRKGVSSNKVLQMQEQLNATSLHYRGRPLNQLDSGEADMDIEMDMMVIEHQQQNARGENALPPELRNGRSAKIVSVDDILGTMRRRLADKKEQRSGNDEMLTKICSQMGENTELIHKFEQGMPQLELKFRMFQETRLYIRDLLDCLNEKIVQIDALDERVSEMWRQRSERLVARRRQDVQDQYERCAATAAGRPWTSPSAEYTQREAEREARRNRRRRERVKPKMPVDGSMSQQHHEGLSSDDEETTSQEVFYRETIASVLQGISDLFVDTSDEFCQLGHILQRLLHWLAVDPSSFEQAYVSLCLPKLLGPFVRLQLVDWRPLKEPPTQRPLHRMPWYRALLLAGLDNSGLEDLEHPALMSLIPSVVEKIVFPKISKIVREQWDPLSLNESANLAQLLCSLIEEYPVANASSKRMQEVLEGIYARLRDTIDRDTFVPLYSKEAIESTETGCGAFLDRQFWKSIKLMRSILCFRSIISDACLEELLVEGLLNRFTVLALQFSVLAHQSTLTKCRAVIEQIPSSWLPPSRPSSYRPLAALLKQVVEAHRRDRKFRARAQRFIGLLAVKEEKEEEEEEEEDK